MFVCLNSTGEFAKSMRTCDLEKSGKPDRVSGELDPLYSFNLPAFTCVLYG